MSNDNKTNNEGQKYSDLKIRPKALHDFIGQHKVKSQMDLFIKAALKRGSVLDHCLFYGPPGLGKTTFALICAMEMDVNIKVTSGPILEKPKDMAAILTSLSAGSILFVDEIHRMQKSVEEVLYSAMEDFKIDLLVGEGMAARSVHLALKHFTLIGATTRIGLISSPLRDRFGIVQRMEFYDSGSLAKIVKRSAKIVGIHIDDKAAQEIAKRSRGTPRIANRLLRRVQDYAEVHRSGSIEEDVAEQALDMFEVDVQGLDKADRHYLSVLIHRYDAGPVGLDTLSTSMHEERGNIEEVIEPYLMQIGLIQRTSRGRIATAKAIELFGGKNMDVSLF